MRRLAAAAAVLTTIAAVAAAAGVTTAGAASPGSSATSSPAIGEISEIAFNTTANAYPFGVAVGADGQLWFADQGCIGTGRCLILRVNSASDYTQFRRGFDPGAIPYYLARRA